MYLSDNGVACKTSLSCFGTISVFTDRKLYTCAGTVLAICAVF